MKKNKKKPLKKIGKRISILQRIIKGKYKNLAQNRKLKSELNYEDILYCIKFFPKDIREDLLFQNPLPKSCDEIKNSNTYNCIGGLAKELSWLCIEINHYIHEINKFLRYKSQFEENFLRGAYDNCKEILKKTEKEICYSFWSMENSFLLSEYMYGLEKNKKDLSDINNSNANTFTIHIAQHLSTKAEIGMSFSNYHRKLQDYLNLYNNLDNKHYKEYFKYKLNKLMYGTSDDRASVIFLEGNSSIIDRFIVFRDILQALWIEKEGTGNHGDIRKILRSISNEIEDKFILKMKKIDQNILFSTEDSVNFDFFDACDNYTSGKYELCNTKSKGLINKYPNTFEFYDLFCKSLIRCKKEMKNELPFKKDCFGNEILTCVNSILTKNSKTNNSTLKLAKMVCQISSFEIFPQLSAFLSEETGGESSEFTKVALLRSTIENIKDFDLYEPSSLAFSFIKLLQEKHKSSSTVKFWEILKTEKNDSKGIHQLEKIVPIERIKLYQAHMKKDCGEYNDAISIYKDLITSQIGFKIKEVPFKFDQVIGSLFYCLVKTNQFDEAIDIIVVNYLQNEHLISKMNTAEVVRKIQNNEEIIDISRIGYPIFVAIKGKNLKSKFIAYDNFLLSQDIERPSQLIDKQKEFEKKKLIYFFYNICNTEILYKSIFFDGTNDIENERIILLRFLSDMDPTNVGLYKSEINEITKRRTLRKGIQELDESKIYVDIDGLLIDAFEKMNESFDRYKQILKLKIEKLLMLDSINGLEAIPLNYETAYKGLKRSLTGQYGFIAFKDIYFEVRDMFISKQHYGLDSYLSTRIRHGTLDGLLFKPFTANKLTTTKNKDNDFIENEYWNTYFYTIDDDKRGEIQGVLSEFSREIDQACTLVKNNWIQIKTEKIEGKGLFDYSYTNEELYEAFISKYSPIEDFNVFIEMIIKDLLERTEKNLVVIKEEIQNDLKDRFFKSLNKLHDFFSDYFFNPKPSKIMNAIANCRTDIQYELDNLSRWFSFSQNRSIKHFDLLLILETSEEVLFNIYQKRINIKKDIQDDILNGLDGKFFVHFVDIFYILLDNIVKHSNLDFDLNEVTIEASSEGQTLKILMTNKLGNSFPFDKSTEKIKTISNEIENGMNSEKWANEGESGFHKINKIIKYDLRCPQYIFRVEPIEESFEFNVILNLLLMEE